MTTPSSWLCGACCALDRRALEGRPVRPAARGLGRVAAAIVVASALGPGASLLVRGAPKTIELPADPVQLVPSALPGYAKAQVQCVACHSAEYMRYQPPTASRPYWDAMVKRMKAVFKAPVDDADMPAIVDYLVKTYGNEQAK